tara:strand:+ start:3305 stop:3718 length:414 start_codon:yes stop_codon:yes gene_type:complete
MIYNILFVISKCIKPFFKDKLLDTFSITEDILICNFIFFIITLLYYKYNNTNLQNIFCKINNDNFINFIIYLLFTAFEIYLNNLILMNKNIIENKILQKSLYIIMMPLFGYFLFNKQIKINTIIGSIIILFGIIIIN